MDLTSATKRMEGHGFKGDSVITRELSREEAVFENGTVSLQETEKDSY